MTRPPKTSVPGATDSESANRELEVMSSMVRYHDWLVDQFKPFLGKFVVEVGAGCGNITSLLLENGVERIIAVEPDGLLFERLKLKFSDNQNVTPLKGFAGNVLTTLDDQPDAIVYINVLEHIEGDAAEVALCMKALKPGGRLCVFVPAMQLLYSAYDHAMGHYRRYSKDELAGICTKTGFKILKLKYFDFSGAFAWYLHFKLLRRMGQNSSFAGVYDNLIVPFTRTVESVVNPCFGKNLVLIAEKPNPGE